MDGNAVFTNTLKTHIEMRRPERFHLEIQHVDAASVDAARFFEIMAAFPTGVCIVTTLDADGTPRGLTTNAVTSVSAEPPLLQVCVDRLSRTLAALRSAERFLVNFMGVRGSDLSRHFASKVEDKFASVEWILDEKTGLPRLHAHSVAWAACETVGEIGAGDHVLLIGRVVAGEPCEGDSQPTVYFRRSYGIWAPAAPLPQRPTDAREPT